MKEWLKANGGPPAVVFTGIGLMSLNQLAGVLIALLGLFYWAYKASWFPYAVVKKKDAMVVQADEQIIKQARAVVKSIGTLLGQHVRYKPPFHNEDESNVDPHLAWVKSVNRSNNHDQSTTARFFEECYEDLMTIVSSLHARGALTQEEVSRINWWVGTSTSSGIAHNLADIPPLIAAAADRLELGKLPDGHEE